MRQLGVRNFWLFVLWALYACVDIQRDRPKEFIEKERMALLLADIHLAESAGRLQVLPPEYSGNPDRWFSEILTYHNTDSAAFRRSYLWYSEDPTLMLELYEVVADCLKVNLEAPPEPIEN